jgi:hypothetical protein
MTVSLQQLRVLLCVGASHKATVQQASFGSESAAQVTVGGTA